MPSTEFLLYLVIVIFIVYIATNYYKDNQTCGTDVQYKYIPVYKNLNDDQSKSDNVSNNVVNENANNGMYNNTHSYYGHHPSHPPFSPNGFVDPHVPPHHPTPHHPPPPSVDPLRKFDYDAIYDEFTPPFRRSYYDDYSSYGRHPALYPTFTRGPVGRFRKIGTLIADGVVNNDKFKFLNLNGREKYPGREFEYYATSTDVKDKIKFYLETKGKEIHDGDIVTIPELKGYSYQYKEDPDLSPRYNPYFV